MHGANILEQAMTYNPQAHQQKIKTDAALDALSQQIAEEAPIRFAEQQSAREAYSVIHELCNTTLDDLDDDETIGERAQALFYGIVNADDDLDSDDLVVLDSLLNHGADILLLQGIEQDDVETMLNSWDDDTFERSLDLIKGQGTFDSVPVQSELDPIDYVVMDQLGMGEATLDAAYKKKKAIRGGKKVMLNKREGGTVKRSAKQRIALKKAQRFAQRSGARKKALKSRKMGQKMGLY